MADQLAIQPFEPQNLDQALRLSEVLAKSALLPDALRAKPADVLVTIITGHELGLSPMQAVRGIHVIKGKGVLSADLAVALVKRHPECLFFRLVDSTDAVATYETERKGEGKTKMSFTAAQAQRAQLGGDNWKKYPAAMLRARASVALARAVYPDMMLGIYEQDEARGFGGQADEVPSPAAEQSSPDVVDGEVVSSSPAPAPMPAAPEMAPPPAASGDMPEEEQLGILLGEAEDLRQLNALVPRLGRLPDAAKAKLRATYNARLAELKKGAAA